MEETKEIRRERLIMIVNLHPVSEYYAENSKVLNLSSIAKKIKVYEAEIWNQTMQHLCSLSEITLPHNSGPSNSGVGGANHADILQGRMPQNGRFKNLVKIN